MYVYKVQSLLLKTDHCNIPIFSELKVAMAKNIENNKANPEVDRSFLIHKEPDSNSDNACWRSVPVSEILVDILTEENYSELSDHCILSQIGATKKVTIKVDIIDIHLKTSSIPYLSKQDLKDYFEDILWMKSQWMMVDGHVRYISTPPFAVNEDYCWLIQFSDSKVVQSLKGTKHIIKGVTVKFSDCFVKNPEYNTIELRIVDQKIIPRTEDCMIEDDRRVEYVIKFFGTKLNVDRALDTLHIFMSDEFGKLNRQENSVQRFISRYLFHTPKYFEKKLGNSFR